MELGKALLAYVEKFGENFPTRMVDLEEDEMIKLIQECIDKNEPYVPEDDDPNILC